MHFSIFLLYLQFCDSTLKESDLQSIALYGDDRVNLGLGALSFSAAKPDLIIVLKRLDPMWLTADRPCTEQEYLDFAIPSDSPLRKAFDTISLVFMPGTARAC